MLMFVEERHEKILNILSNNNRILAKDLAKNFDVSIDTIRRDLKIMEEKGLLKRTYGGAIANRIKSNPRPINIRYGEGNEEEKKIAQTACTLINEGDTIFVGGASMNYHMVKFLPLEFMYTLVTNSIEVAYHARKLENINLIMTPGNVKSSGNISDNVAQSFISNLNFDLVFIVGGGLNAEFGVTTSSLEVAYFYKELIRCSRQVICLLEQSKVDKKLFSKIIDIENIDLIIAGRDTSNDLKEKLAEKGVDILLTD